MNCALTVLKSIVSFGLFFVFVLAAGLAVFGAAFGTAWLLGLASNLGWVMGIFLFYGIIAGGTVIGIEECHR